MIFEAGHTYRNRKGTYTVLRVDPAHSAAEDRYIDIGYSDRGQLPIVVYTERAARIRIISCRKATNAERMIYERR